MRWTRLCRTTSGADADGEIVWSWPPDAEVKLRQTCVLRDDGGYQARTPGRTRISRKPLRRECRVVRRTCSPHSRAFFVAREAMGALFTRHSLRPLSSRDTTMHHSGAFVPRECVGASLALVIASEAKQSRNASAERLWI